MSWSCALPNRSPGRLWPNPAIERSAQQLRRWVPVALRAPAPAHCERSASEASTRLMKVRIREDPKPSSWQPDAGVYLHHRTWENLS